MAAESNGKRKKPYEQKFDDLIRLLADTPEEIVVIHHPQVLGDDYDEIVESLNRLANAEKAHSDRAAQGAEIVSDRFWEVTLMYRHKEYLVAKIPITKITRSRLHTLMIAIYVKYMLTVDEAVRGLLNPPRRKKGAGWCQPLIPLYEEHNDPNTIIIPSGGDWVHAIVRRPGDSVQTDLPPPPPTGIVSR